MPGSEPSSPEEKATSSFQLNITLAIGYNRKRAELAGAWESNFTTIGLLVGGIIVVLLFLYWILTRLGGLPF
jgi:hypothetical protein